MNVQKHALRGKPLLQLIADAALAKKAEDIVVLSLEEESGIADWFLVCQGDNPLHNRAIAGSIMDSLDEHGLSPWHAEGLAEGRWILLDYSDVIVHVMIPEARRYYALEELWQPGDVALVKRDPHE
jgi:ribosome-associated protein